LRKRIVKEKGKTVELGSKGEKDCKRETGKNRMRHKDPDVTKNGPPERRKRLADRDQKSIGEPYFKEKGPRVRKDNTMREGTQRGPRLGQVLNRGEGRKKKNKKREMSDETSHGKTR